MFINILRAASLGVATALAAAASACAYRAPAVHLSGEIPPLAPDALAIEELTLRDERYDVSMDSVARVRKDAARILRRAASARAGSGAPGAAARVRLHVAVTRGYGLEDSMRVDGLAAIGMLPGLAGMTVDHERIAVELALETRGRTWVGHGYGGKDGSLYSPARRRALAEAIDVAFAHAVEVTPPGARPPDTVR